MTTNLFTDLNETQSEAINGGFLDFTSTKRIRVRVNQENASATLIGFTLGSTTTTQSNTSNNTATIS
jgi:hypothetical protein